MINGNNLLKALIVGSFRNILLLAISVFMFCRISISHEHRFSLLFLSFVVYIVSLYSSLNCISYSLIINMRFRFSLKPLQCKIENSDPVNEGYAFAGIETIFDHHKGKWGPLLL